MNNELISIAMCTYNGERFLKQQLDSICTQSFKNFELIIVDDVSSDGTVDIINAYAKKDSRIKFYINKNNLGFKKNFEKAISLCSANYIALSDQDDIWKPHKLRLFISQIGEHSLIYSDAILIDQYSNELNEELVRSKKRHLVQGNCNKAFILDNCVSGNTLMFKKEIIENIIPIPDNISYHDIWIAFIASTYGTIIYTDEAMTYYRRYTEQVTHKNTEDFIDEDIMRLYRHRTSVHYKIYKTRKNHLKDLQVLSQVSNIDSMTESIIQSLLEHFQSYEHIYFNKELNLLLHKHKDDILAITDKDERAKKVHELSVGLKYYKNIFFYTYSFIKGFLRLIRLRTKNIRKSFLKISSK